MFKYSCPLQIPQAVLHLIPYFLHEHRFVSQSDLQLHRMIFRRREGAAGRSVALGTNLVPAFFQPHSSGFSELPSYSCTWWYIRYEWNFAAAEVGGRHFACKYVVPLATLAQYILYLRSSKESEEAPPNSNTSIFSPISWMVFWFCSGERKWYAKARRSSDALNFCRADIFPIPYGFDVVSQPLAAWMTGRMQQRLPIASLVCLIFQHLEIFPRVPWLGTRKMSCAEFSAILYHPLSQWSVFYLALSKAWATIKQSESSRAHTDVMVIKYTGRQTSWFWSQNWNLTPKMSLVIPKYMETTCHTFVCNLVLPAMTIPPFFNMATGGHLGFWKSHILSHSSFAST